MSKYAYKKNVEEIYYAIIKDSLNNRMNVKTIYK